jgi:hypothetical protein
MALNGTVSICVTFWPFDAQSSFHIGIPMCYIRPIHIYTPGLQEFVNCFFTQYSYFFLGGGGDFSLNVILYASCTDFKLCNILIL